MTMRALLSSTLLFSTGAFAADAPAERLWEIRAVLPEGVALEVKAVDKAGKTYEVKAVEAGDLHLMDVVAIAGAKRWPVKVLDSDDAFAPVKAIADDGTIVDVKAFTKDGGRLDVKGVAHAGSLVHIKAIGPAGALYGVKAFSPEGHLEDVKGVKLSGERIETTLHGVAVAAHVEALPQVADLGTELLWRVRAITPDAKLLEVRAFDKTGKSYELLVMAENGNFHLLDVKAVVNAKKVPVKIVAADGLGPLQAIGSDGTLYDLKAIAADGSKLDVKGVAKAGNVVQVKAAGPNGALYGVKAISPGGQLADLKGVRLGHEKVEGKINGVDFGAHVKALPQVPGLP